MFALAVLAIGQSRAIKKSGHSFPLCSILPPFDKGRKFGAYNGHLHSSQPAATRAALAGISRPFKVTKSEEKSPSEFAFGRERQRERKKARMQ